MEPIEIDCRKCKTLSMINGVEQCAAYGPIPNIAVKKCADAGFTEYRPEGR